MTRHRFHVPEIAGDADQALLSRDQSRQVSRVLRLRTGDQIAVFDGQGTEWTGELLDRDGDRWRVALRDRHRPAREPDVRLTVGLSVIRNERFDLAVQKLTELGVARIVPVMAGRSMISYDDKRTWQKRRARIERIVVEAAEQSERATLPLVDDPQDVQDFLERQPANQTLALVERRPVIHISEGTAPNRELVLLVGPEGGWTEDEIVLIERHATPVSLGDLILRSETAAIVAAGCLILGTKSTLESRP